MEQKTMHFAIEGEFVTNAAREKLFAEKDLAAAIRILRSCTVSDELTSDEQLMLCLQILNSDASIVGNSGDGSYGVETRDDMEENPTQLSNIATLLSDTWEEIKKLREQKYDLMLKMAFLAHELGPGTLRSANDKHYEKTGEPLFEDMAISPWVANAGLYSEAAKGLPRSEDLVTSYLEQRRREDEAEEEGEEICDYGWLAPDGTFYPVEWGYHAKWANDWLEEHMPYKEHPEVYRWMDDQSIEHAIFDVDVLIYSLGWCLLHSPWQGLAELSKSPGRNLTKAQKEFLYDYYTRRNRHEEANRLCEEV